MLYGIISYHRAETQKTLKFLRKWGVPRENIILSLNDPDDKPEYDRRYGKEAKIICTEKHNAAGNRNNILDYVGKGKRLILMDDDVKGIMRWLPIGKQGKLEKASRLDFEDQMDNTFEIAEHFGSRIVGLYPVANTLFISQTQAKDGPVSRNKLFQGGCMGIITSGARFNENIPVCDDYEFILRQIERGYGDLRLNVFAAEKDRDFDTKGGCYEAYASGAQEKALRMIAKKYSDLVTLKKDASGLVMKQGKRG